MGIKTRRHHNNKGRSQINQGFTRLQVEKMVKKLKKEGVIKSPPNSK